MDELFPLLLFLIFVLGPLIEQIRKKGGDQPKPPQRRPEARTPRPRPEYTEPYRSKTEEVSAKSAERDREAAAEMVPADLWKILTGEAPPQRLPAPPQKPKQPWDVVYDPEAADEEEASSREDVDVEVRRSSREAVERDHAGRIVRGEAVSLETPVNIVSLETTLPSPEARHAAFHKRMEALPAPAQIARRKRRKLGLTDRSELQRAFVLQEVFGKPRGLE